MMDAIEAIRSRRSIRVFKPEPVPRKVLQEVLDASRWAPSWANSQPWEFAVVGGKVLDQLKDRLEERVKAKSPESPEIPKPGFTGQYLARIERTRDILDSFRYPPGVEITPERRAEYVAKASRFLGAPNGIIVYIERSLGPYAIFDAGMMAQTICLTAHAMGLGTCLMARVTYFPDILREVLKIPESKLIVIGIAIGYPDPKANYNNYVRSREPLDTMVNWHGI
ncbi:MAG: nitroreductase [Chloroflexi bacterium]|nr:nitroreductase [Chloroflexota bacterium]